jgi:hypothetical protein
MELPSGGVTYSNRIIRHQALGRGTVRGTSHRINPAQRVSSMRLPVPSVQLARTVHGAVLLVNGRSAVRTRSPAPHHPVDTSPLISGSRAQLGRTGIAMLARAAMMVVRPRLVTERGRASVGKRAVPPDCTPAGCLALGVGGGQIGQDQAPAPACRRPLTAGHPGRPPLPTARGVAVISQLIRSSLVNSYAAPAQDCMRS